MKIGKTFRELFGNTLYDMDYPISFTNGQLAPIYIINGEFMYVYKGIFYTAHEYFDILKLD